MDATSAGGGGPDDLAYARLAEKTFDLRVDGIASATEGVFRLFRRSGRV
ncbi:MAG TPA: hypothetical protein VMD77_06225 [Candidatus Baltobacteraceae bacterium]|nr:hypothetical protein [Candidatus Baltobacteraceae bacterium]